MQKISSNTSEVDHRRQHRICASQQTFISGTDYPDDKPEHRLVLS